MVLDEVTMGCRLIHDGFKKTTPIKIVLQYLNTCLCLLRAHGLWLSKWSAKIFKIRFNLGLNCSDNNRGIFNKCKPMILAFNFYYDDHNYDSRSTAVVSLHMISI